MDSKKYYGLIIIIATLIIALIATFYIVTPKVTEIKQCNTDIETAQRDKKDIAEKLQRVKKRIEDTKNAIAAAPKKVYSPIESDLGQDTLFFTLYNDIIEMVHTNSIKVKSIEYSYNPEKDAFVEFGKDVYFVCDVDMDLVANYISIGNLVQDIYQYPYYIKINKLEVIPYEKDKKILLAKMSLRLYAHTAADTFVEPVETPATTDDNKTQKQ